MLANLSPLRFVFPSHFYTVEVIADMNNIYGGLKGIGMRLDYEHIVRRIQGLFPNAPIGLRAFGALDFNDEGAIRFIQRVEHLGWDTYPVPLVNKKGQKNSDQDVIGVALMVAAARSGDTRAIVLITGDGDFALYFPLLRRDKVDVVVIAPSRKALSRLLLESADRVFVLPEWAPDCLRRY
ncbi:NYN domain-containing protein [Candidatus Parcubacteria bacterium]|nr:MAG: NYN domain-containing protein [Candidatus Parcubacteria bacterium]